METQTYAVGTVHKLQQTILGLCDQIMSQSSENAPVPVLLTSKTNNFLNFTSSRKAIIICSSAIFPEMTDYIGNISWAV